MHYKKKNPTYEKIRYIPVLALLQMNSYTLKRLEKQIKKEFERAQLALKWIRGVQRIKKSHGGRNG